MRKITLMVTLLAGVAATEAQAQAPAPTPSGDAALISSAMQAAPKSVAEGATIVAMGADHKLRTLRPGTNGWTCMPDNPDSPGPDPMCMDANALAWAQAWIGKQAPPADRIGFMYMLAGGTDASNTDPYATGPAAGNAWIETGPHVMIVGPAAMHAMAGYPREAKPDTAKPYVMWPGTPYEHLMIPVR